MNARTLIPTYEPQNILGQAILGNPDECWLWQGSKYQNGYGKYGRAGYMAHRITYEMIVGEVPSKMFLDHTCYTRECSDGMECGHRSCINPNHLEVVTKGENVLRGNSASAINAEKTHCLNGHEFTEKNTYIQMPKGMRVCRRCKADREAVRRRLKLTPSNIIRQ